MSEEVKKDQFVGGVRAGGAINPVAQAVPELRLRYVIYDSAKGVYLAAGRWANVNPGAVDAALTYDAGTADALVKQLRKNGEADHPRAVECVPDRGHNMASIKAVEGRMLPGWTPAAPTDQEER